MNKLSKNKKIIITIIIISLVLTIILVTNKKKNMFGVEKYIGGVFTPIEKGISGAKNFLKEKTKFLDNKEEILSKNEKLEKENLKLKNENIEMGKIIGKKDYLRDEYELSKNSKYNFIPAKVIAKESENWFERFKVDKGKKDGVKVGDNVILGSQTKDKDKDVIEEGLVGRVTEVGNTWSKVTAIIDPKNNISFNAVNTRDSGILKGNTKGKLEGYMLDHKSKIKKGTKLVSTGVSGVYKEGIYIGEVTKVVRNKGDLKVSVEVDPSINFSKIYDIFIITGEK